MSRSLASELPAELLERIFNASQPSGPSGLVLSLRDLVRPGSSAGFPSFGCSRRRRLPRRTASDAAFRPGLLQMCCQLVCKSWLHALVTGRLTVQQLYLAAGAPEDVPRRALWVQRLRPAVRELTIDLGCKSPKAVLDSWDRHENDVPALVAVLRAVDALQPPQRERVRLLHAHTGGSRAVRQSPAACHVLTALSIA